MEHEKLISEPLRAIFEGTGTDTPMAAGEPVVPSAFEWRGSTYPVLRVLQSGRGLGPCTHGSGEQYLRRHWYRFASNDGIVMRVYFERRPQSARKATKRWWLYSIATLDTAEAP